MAHEFSSVNREIAIVNSLDHASITESSLYELLATANVSQAIDKLYTRFDEAEDPLFMAVRNLAKFVEPMDTALGIDPERMVERTVIAGGITAMLVLEYAAIDADLEAEDVLKHTAGFSIRVVDTSKLTEVSIEDTQARVGVGIMNVGEYDLERLPAEYQVLIDDLIDVYPEIGRNVNVYKNAFGFFAGAGMRSLADIMSHVRARIELSECDDIEEQWRQLSAKGL
ncbi:MAG: hypothetical protein V4678_00210 [Patescibacteria group bacterium]